MNTKATLKAACLGVGMATAWGAASSAKAHTIEPLNGGFDTHITGAITPTHTLNRAYFVYFLYANNGSGLLQESFELNGPLTANTTTPYMETVLFRSFEEFSSEGYVIIAEYQDGAEIGVTISFPDASGVIGQQSWSDIFEDPNDGRDDYSETFIHNAVVGIKSDAYLGYFAREYYDILGTAYGQNATLVNFSTGTFGGTVTPEPAGIVVLSLSCLGVLSNRRRPSSP